MVILSVGSIFLDLSQVFDTINHGKLINELEKYGVTGQKLDWFTNYLFNRHQTVDIKKLTSSAEPLYCGVPQRGILSPLLFVIFFYNLLTQLKNLSIILPICRWCGDIPWSQKQDMNKISRLLNEDLDLISTHFNDNEWWTWKEIKPISCYLVKDCQSFTPILISTYYRGKSVNNTEKYKYLGNVVDPALKLNLDMDQKYKHVQSSTIPKRVYGK